MRFVDEQVSREHRYSLGTDTKTGNKYISIPVSNQLVDYEEYYAVDPEIYEALLKDAEQARTLAEKCRRRENDGRLIIKPGSSRGSPS